MQRKKQRETAREQEGLDAFARCLWHSSIDRRLPLSTSFLPLSLSSPNNPVHKVLIPAADSPSPTAGADAVPRSNFAFDFDAERRAVEKAEKAAEAAAAVAAPAADDDGAAPSSSSSSSSSPWTPPDPWSALFGEHREASREEVALAAAAAAELAKAAGGGRGGGAEELERSLRPLRQLTAMGFDPRRALGALVVSGGDLAAATDACLAAAAASGARI